jgi:hypothetical protein
MTAKVIPFTPKPKPLSTEERLRNACALLGITADDMPSEGAACTATRDGDDPDGCERGGRAAEVRGGVLQTSGGTCKVG